MTKEKEISISVPVYVTKHIERKSDSLFGSCTYDTLIDDAQNLFDNYQANSIRFSKQGKSKETIIQSITYSRVTSLDRSALLVRASVYDTNLQDGYFEGNDAARFDFQRTNKIGSDTNYFLLYPVIDGSDPANFTSYFQVLVYEDPNKESGSVARIAKKLIALVLRQPVRNVKKESVLEMLRTIGTTPQLQISYLGYRNSEQEFDSRYAPYVTDCHITSKKEQKLESVPFPTIQAIMEDDYDVNIYQKRVIKAILGKKEVVVTKEFKEAKQIFAESAEQVLNDKIVLTQEESERIFDEDFIVEKLSAVLSNVLNG